MALLRAFFVVTYVILVTTRDHEVIQGRPLPALTWTGSTCINPANIYTVRHQVDVCTSEDTPSPASLEAVSCIAILTGYPTVTYRLPYVVRVISSLLDDFHVDPSVLQVFCQGSCQHLTDTMSDLQPRAGDITYHELNNTVNKTEYVGFIITQNYVQMFERLFKSSTTTNTGLSSGRHQFCVILEDDLLLSPDALKYFAAGQTLMRADHTVFTVSAYNDNSYPSSAADTSFFRRVEHFSGLGFLMSADWYETVVHDEMRINREHVWDALLQSIVSRYQLVSVQPEVSRVLHTSGTGHVDMTVSPDDRIGYGKYDAQLINHISDLNYSLYSAMQHNYEAYILRHIVSATPIVHLEDAGFYGPEDKLVYVKCDTVVCIDDLFRARHLNGRGLGGVLRGVYQGTVFIRVYDVLVLIIMHNSNWFPVYSSIFPGLRPNPVPALILHMEQPASVDRQHTGTLYRLLSSYQLVVSSSSCSAECSQRGTTCSRAGLWTLAVDCSVLRRLFGCTSCSQLTDFRDSFSAPAFLQDGSCTTTANSIPFSINCFTLPKASQRRLCTCRAIA